MVFNAQDNQTDQILSKILSKKRESFSEKKPLRDVLSNFMREKSKKKDSVDKMKEELTHIEHNTTTSYEALVEIQKKLSKVYVELKNEKEKKD